MSTDPAVADQGKWPKGLPPLPLAAYYQSLPVGVDRQSRLAQADSIGEAAVSCRLALAGC